MNRTALACTTIATLGLLAAAAILTAGPLSPPAGPVTSSYKTLSEVEPRIALSAANTPGDADSVYRITQPGSYYLTGNITGIAGKRGIEITVDGVSIDLMGFEMSGVAGSLQGISIVTTVFLRNVEVRNGSVRGWGGSGVEMYDSVNGGGASNCRFECLRIHANGGYGLHSGSLAAVEACQSFQNGNIGIVAGGVSVVTGCASSYNTGGGIVSGGESVISDCVVSDNSGDGINVSNGRTTISGCTAIRSGDDGIDAGSGCTISNCTAEVNSNDGIAAAVSCVIINNNCYFNGINTADGAGIRVTGGSNRIEGNSCTSNDFGIKADAAGNLILRNSARSNPTNFSIVAGNTTGTIVATEAAMNAAANNNVNISF